MSMNFLGWLNPDLIGILTFGIIVFLFIYFKFKAKDKNLQILGKFPYYYFALIKSQLGINGMNWMAKNIAGVVRFFVILILGLIAYLAFNVLNIKEVTFGIFPLIFMLFIFFILAIYYSIAMPKP